MSQTAATADKGYTAAREHAPSSVAGPVAWLRTNLFSSWLSTAVTLLLGYLILRVVIGFISWAVLHAIWRVQYNAQRQPDTAACIDVRGTGACWAIIGNKYRLILFGRYPYDEQWRPAICVVLFLALYVVSAIRAFWRPVLVLIWI